MDGILNINKPAGKTSFDVVAKVKHLTGEKRVGHAGTLDPLATGVLPVCIGQATRLVEYLMDTTKTYLAEIEMGITTSTYDAEGEITNRADASGLTREQIVAALHTFLGATEQTPPMYSALKHQGKPLYELARAGVAVERKPRPVMIYSIELKDWSSPIATIEVVCGKGTYIRSLANDLGQMLGCGASLKNLIRTRCGIFNYNNAITLEQLQEAYQAGYWESLLYPMDSILADWEAVIVGEELEKSIRDGKTIAIGASQSISKKDYCRAYTRDGCLLAVLHFDAEQQLWQPEKVFGNRENQPNCANSSLCRCSSLTPPDLCDKSNIRAIA